MGKKVLFLSIIIIMAVIILLKSFSFNENIESSYVVEVKLEQYLGEYKVISYTAKSEIDHILKTINSMNFYISKEAALHESPTRSIRIKFMDGSQIIINVAGFMASIVEYNETGVIINNGIYYINPIRLKFIFK